MTIDILFLTKDRYEYTYQALRALLANTNWDMVRHLVLVDDNSTDGTSAMLLDQKYPCTTLLSNVLGGTPASVIKKFSALHHPPDCFVKVDSDAIVPPGWLQHAAAVMQNHPELDLLGLEPPLSRVPYCKQRGVAGAPENRVTQGVIGYAPCDSIGGIGIMRTAAFRSRPPIVPVGTYGGFGDWQRADKTLKIGWIVPPINLFLLDRLPMEPWVSLGKQYEAEGWQRPWPHYGPEAASLWDWWTPV